MIYLLLLVLFVAPTIHYRVELGGASFMLMEPVVLFVSTALLGQQFVQRRSIFVLKDPLIFLFLTMALWSLLVRPWGLNSHNGISDIRDWFVPTLGFVTLLSTIRHGWRKWIMLFLFVVVLQSLLGIYQHSINGMRPFVSELSYYKTSFLIDPETKKLMFTSFAVGLFSHPNGFAIYIFIGLMIALGWNAQANKRWLKVITLIPIVLCLYFTYAKASLLVVVFAVFWLWLQFYIKSGSILLLLTGAIAISGLMTALLSVQFVPEAFLLTFWWRVGLWESALIIISRWPGILLLGNGLDLFVRQAYYGQPHSLYFYLLLQYGSFGLIWVGILFWVIWKRGWCARQSGLMVREPLLAGLWVALVGYFVVGLVESSLFGIESRMIFMLVVACFAGLMREVRRESLVVVTEEEQCYVSSALADPRSV
jgi:hypothetical protein